jgi:hypothetical protein
VSLSIGAPLGNLEEGLLHRGLRETGKRMLWRGSVSLPGGSVWGSWRGAPLLGTWKDMQKKAMVAGISLHGGSVWETWRGNFFTGDFQRQVKEGSGNGASFCMGF